MKESLYYLFLSGLILGSGPCLGLCVPVLASFVATYKPSLKKAFISYSFFSLAKISGYVFLGVLVGIFSGVLRKNIFISYANIINILLGAFVLFIGIVTMISKEPLKSRYCEFLHKGNVKNAGILGFLTGLSPCLPLLGVLNYIMIISRSPLEGAFYAFTFGLGTSVSPVILLVGVSGKISGALSVNQKMKMAIRILSSLILVFLGVNIIAKSF